MKHPKIKKHMVLKFLIEKEFKQIRRNKFLPRAVFGMPLFAVLIFPLVANFEVKDIKLSVVDHSHSTYSRALTQKVVSSGYFQLSNFTDSYATALKDVEMDVADVVLEIPAGFERDLLRGQKVQILVSANAVNGMKGGLSTLYLNGIIQDFNREIRAEFVVAKTADLKGLETITKYDFNPQLEYKFTMIPAIMMMVLAMIAGFIPALNIVSEKEKGTIEQLNVTPVSKFQVIIAKLFPYWMMGFLVLTIMFLVAWLAYGLISVGGYGLIYAFAAVFVLAFSGLGLMISNYANNVQQGMFMMFFFVISFIFLSGLYTPVASMPDWLQTISRFSPLRYMVEVLRSVYLKGSTFWDLKWHFAALTGFALFFNAWAVLSYRKTGN